MDKGEESIWRTTKMCMSGLPLKVFIVDKSSCFRNASWLQAPKILWRQAPKNSLQNPIQDETFFFFLKSIRSLATSAMQPEHIHWNCSEVSKLMLVLKTLKRLGKSCKSEEGTEVSKLSSTAAVVNLCHAYLVQLAFQCGYLFRIGESDVKSRRDCIDEFYFMFSCSWY